MDEAFLPTAPRGLRWRLSVMMFLQYAVMGAWSPILALHLDELGIDGAGIGWIYSTIAFSAMVAPFIAGQIADRYFATERYMTIVHLLGAGLLFYAATLTSFRPLFVTMLLYCLLYTPTMALSNSLAFAHLREARESFGQIRLWGTIGWVVVGWGFGMWLGLLDPFFQRFIPRLAESVAALREVFGQPTVGNCLHLAGGLSLLLGLYSTTLPHTPPTKSVEKPWAFLEAIRLMRKRDFAVLAIVSFFVATELAFYYQLTPLFFREGVGLPKAWVSPVMTIGQIAEVLVLVALPWSLRRLGVRETISIGIAAWPIRYSVFALGYPRWLVLASQSLHGVCYAFFVVASQVYVDSIASGDIRASAQNFLTFLNMGVGKFLGNIFAGKVDVLFRRDFRKIFLLPVIITSVCLVAFRIGFKGERARAAEEKEREAAS